MDIDTHDVLEAAGTKWDFLPFKPAVVGGHCIGVDPYYLTHMATVLGYHPELILAARRINNRMGLHVTPGYAPDGEQANSCGGLENSRARTKL